MDPKEIGRSYDAIAHVWQEQRIIIAILPPKHCS